MSDHQTNTPDQIEAALAERVKETNNFFSLFSNSLTVVTWVSLNIVALYIFFSSYFVPLEQAVNGRFAGFIAIGLAVVSVGSCVLVVGMVLYAVLPLIHGLTRSAVSTQHSEWLLVIPAGYIILMGFLIFIVTSQTLSSLGIISI